MGVVINHPRRVQRVNEVKFKLVDVISGLGMTEAFQELPEAEKEELWRQAYVYEIESPNAGVNVLKSFFGGQPYKNGTSAVYNT